MATDTAITILLIEDSPSDVRLIKESLRDMPHDSFHIIAALSLAQGLRKLAQNSVDAILLDLGLPDSQGIDTFKAIHKQTPALPIIVLTVADEDTLGQQVVQQGAQDYIPKDVLAQETCTATLTRAIRYAIERKRVEMALQNEHDEVQRLNEELQLTTEELRTANEKLEQRVLERTEELAAAAASLEESEARYRRLVERSFDAVLIHSDGVIRLANESAARVLKAASPADLVGMNILDLPSHRYKELAKERISCVYATKQSSVPAELEYCALDGTTIEVEAMATPITYEGKPALYVVFRDISDRKRMEAQLKQYAQQLEHRVTERTAQLAQSEEEFRTLFEASNVAQIRYNADGRPIRINKAAAVLLGVRDAADLKKLSIWSSSRVPEESKAQLRAGCATRFERVCNFQAIRKTGHFPTVRSDVRYVDFYLLPLFGTSGNDVEGYLGQLVDITERKQAEAALQASEEQYRTLVETANSVIIAMKTDRTITFINDYGARFFGYTPEELIGKDVMIIVPEVESTGRPLAPHIGDILARPDEYATNLNENITKDGRRVWVQWVNRGLVDHDGRHIGDLAVGIDVTALKHTEAALKEAERLAAIGQTATMIGHDLRNPLQALQFSLELERKYVETALQAARADPTVEKTVEKAIRLYVDMEQQIRYMDKIVADLQDYARPLPLERELTNIPSVIDATLSALTIPESISTHIDISDPITAMLNPHLMQRALSNLIMNAVQAMPKGGELTIDAAADGHAAVIHIHDTGDGVPENMKDTLFSPLTTGKAKGTGLGLAVVKRIVEAHNGTITFESEEGKGTTFTVTLPQTAE